MLVLSLFPGIDLLGRAFESEGFCVVRGPDPVTGGDIRDFSSVPGKFDGIVAGPPCQGFSSANRHRNDLNHDSFRYSIMMLHECRRVIAQACPTWWLIENVPGVPNVRIEGYQVQRFGLADWECGGMQIRNRHFQFGHRDGHIIRPVRTVTRRQDSRSVSAVTCKPSSKHSSWKEQCRRQGLEDIKLPGWYREAKFRAVGNGVPMSLGRVVAAAVKRAGPVTELDCPCGCGRAIAGKQKSATATCRKILQRRRDAAGVILKKI